MGAPRRSLAGTILSGTTRPGVKLAKGYAQQFDASGKPIGFVKAGMQLGQGQIATFGADGRVQVSRGQPPIAGGPGYAFSPFTVGKPPAGTYDVSLDQQERAAGRGLAQTLQDLGTAGSRADSQLTLDRASVDQNFSRQSADLATSDKRNQQDAGTSLADIARSFQRQAAGQRQSASAAGIAGGGALLAAQQARAANQGLAEAPVNTALSRALESNATARDRLTQDVGPQGTANAQLDRQYGYGAADRGQQAQRATDENLFFGQDVAAQRYQQAGQFGVVSPSRPKNEFRDAQGNPYRVLRQGKRTVAVDPLGKVLWRRAAGVRV